MCIEKTTINGLDGVKMYLTMGCEPFSNVYSTWEIARIIVKC